MAIEGLYLQLLHQAIGKLRTRVPRPRALLLAYPDLVVPRAALARLVGEATLEGLPEREDAPAAWEAHGLAGVADPMYETLAFLRRLGVEPEVTDVVAQHGVERIVDLNEPLPADLARRFDLVVDTGTLEHCFNVGQAFRNACEALAQGGVLVHAAPLNRPNHGFWNFSPTVYPDFFLANGFEAQVISGASGDLARGMRTFAVDLAGRFEAPAGAVVYAVAERREVRDLVWPVQRKYQAFIP